MTRQSTTWWGRLVTWPESDMNPSPTGFVTGRELTPGTPTAIYFSWTKNNQVKKKYLQLIIYQSILHAGYTCSILINSVWNEFHIYFALPGHVCVLHGLDSVRWLEPPHAYTECTDLDCEPFPQDALQGLHSPTL